MRIFDETKTTELESYDPAKGILRADRLFIAHHEAVEEVKEVGHYETIKEYPNGGKDVKWVVDVEGTSAKDAWDEYEDIQVFIPFTEKELAQKEIGKLKSLLSGTDYQAIKFAEGLISEADYAPIREQRQAWRDQINDLEQV